MKKLFVLLAAIMLMAGIAQAQDRGTPAEAKAMVKKAVAYVKEVGRDQALVEFNNPKGKFIYKDLYIYAGTIEDAVTLAHPFTPALIGKNMMNLKDADGKPFIKEKNEMGKKYGGGEISYRWTHPQSKKVEMKYLYFEVVDGLTINCGYYK
jgi:hypothetical protein